jgi:hypothetical protein
MPSSYHTQPSRPELPFYQDRSKPYGAISERKRLASFSIRFSSSLSSFGSWPRFTRSIRAGILADSSANS